MIIITSLRLVVKCFIENMLTHYQLKCGSKPLDNTEVMFMENGMLFKMHNVSWITYGKNSVTIWYDKFVLYSNSVP